MSGGVNRLFRQWMAGELFGIASPLRYLQSNIFSANLDTQWAAKGCGLFTVEIYQESTSNRLNVRPAPPRLSPTSHAFKAYWCGWGSKMSRTVTLGNQANFFFTPPLNGCRLEIAGNRITHHDGLVQPWPPVGTVNIPRGGGRGHRYWDCGNEYVSIVFGVRRFWSWHFYQQSWSKQGDTWLSANQVSIV